MIVFFHRTIPNSEHSVAGHTLSLEFDVRAFFLSLVEVHTHTHTHTHSSVGIAHLVL